LINKSTKINKSTSACYYNTDGIYICIWRLGKRKY